MHAYTSTGWSIADWEILLSIWTSWLPLGVGWTIILPILVGHVLFSEQVMAKPLKSNTNTRKQKGNNDKVLSYSISILELTIMNHPQPSTTPPPAFGSLYFSTMTCGAWQFMAVKSYPQHGWIYRKRSVRNNKLMVSMEVFNQCKETKHNVTLWKPAGVCSSHI